MAVGAADEEFAALKSQLPPQTLTAVADAMHLVCSPSMALMAATVLNGARAVEVSIYVVRAFVRLRELALTQSDFAARHLQPQRAQSAQVRRAARTHRAA